MSLELTKAISALADKLQIITGELARASGANIDKSWSQEYSLDTATTKENPLDRIVYDFKSFAIVDGTDPDTYVYVILDRVNGGKRGFKVKNNVTYNTTFQVSEITIYSPAQSGKKITLNLFKDANFTTGQLINSGTVTVAPATARIVTNPALTAGVATLILAQDSTRKKATLQNNIGSAVFLGPLGVTSSGATRGIELASGATAEDINTAALYAYSVAGCAVGDFTVKVET